MTKPSAKNYQSGYIILVLTVLFAALSLVLVIGGAIPVMAHYGSMKAYAGSKQSFISANTAINEAIYRLKTGKSLPGTLEMVTSTGTSTVTTTATPNGKRIIVDADRDSFKRSFQIDLLYGTGVSFHYGVQSGNGGFVLQNSSSVTGNVYSNGSVTGADNLIYGDVVSAGPSGLISGIHATGTAMAHRIENSIVDKNAHYQTISNTTVSGTQYPNSPDQAPQPMPISDAQIEEWKTWAASGGIAACSNGVFNVTSSMSLGPIKIPCDLLIKGNTVTLNVTGPIWVEGNITTQTGPTIRIDPGQGAANIAIIADKPSNRAGSGIIDVGQSTVFQGSGSSGSFVFAISMNNSSETGGSTNAIEVGQSAGAAVVYASHGQITLGQSVNIKEVTAYKIILQNTANVRYDTGLPSVLFESGPSGGFEIITWKEL